MKKSIRELSTQEVLQRMEQANQSSLHDPNGSYTGKPADKDEVPVQDVDDL